MRMLLNTRGHRVQTAIALMMIVAIAACPGCASKSKKWKFAKWDVRKAVGLKADKPDPETPSRLVATWTETVLSTTGQKPTRGFGGRLAFFTRASDEPVRVEGQLVVYAFDETSRPSHETQPTRRYIFPAEEVALHESDNKLGPSYSFWLPWDEQGGTQRNISLIARFEPKDGPIVLGEQTRILLPGPATLEPNPGQQIAERVRSDAADAVRLATYSGMAAATTPARTTEPSATGQPISEAAAVKKPMTTETIALPPRLGTAMTQQTSTISDRHMARLPLSQVAIMQSEKAANADAAPHAEPVNAQSSSVAEQGQAAVTGRPAVGPLRDSLRDSLRAREMQGARAALGPGR